MFKIYLAVVGGVLGCIKHLNGDVNVVRPRIMQSVDARWNSSTFIICEDDVALVATTVGVFRYVSINCGAAVGGVCGGNFQKFPRLAKSYLTPPVT